MRTDRRQPHSEVFPQEAWEYNRQTIFKNLCQALQKLSTVEPGDLFGLITICESVSTQIGRRSEGISEMIRKRRVQA